MKASQRRTGLAQARAAEAAWIGAHVGQADLNKYMEVVTGNVRLLPPEALAGVMSTASAGLPKITMAQYRKKGS